MTERGKLGRKLKETIFFNPTMQFPPHRAEQRDVKGGISSEIPTSDHLIWLPFSVQTALPNRSEAERK